MRIESIYVSNFLGARAVDIKVAAPVLLVCGPNAAGKSSIRDAVALALTADLGRVSLKKDAAQLISDGADSAVVEVIDADSDGYTYSITKSKTEDGHKGRERDPVLPYVLDAQRFARLPETERRAFLFGLVGLKMDHGEIARRLEKRGGHIGKVQRILPLLRTGFDAAAKQAKTYATEAKGAWRTVTGETFGSEKAKTWKATVPPYDAASASEVFKQLQHADVAIGQWRETIGKLQGEEKRRADMAMKLPALAEHAATLVRLRAKLKADEQQLVDWEADLQKTAAAAGAAPRVGLLHDLARMLYELAIHPSVGNTIPDLEAVNVLLSAYEKEHGPLDGKAGDARAQARLPKVRESRDLCARTVANDKRDIAAAEAAQVEHDRIKGELAAEFDADGLANARAQVEQLKAERALVVKRSDEMRSIKALVDSAEAKTKQAGEHAVDVADWDLIGDALSPDGIPAELLAEAIAPINERLAQSAADTAWQQVVIHDDMRITYGARAYGLISESERWRCDAMLAEAIAQISGTRLLVLDRMDVLDLQSRGDLLGWLDLLAENGEVDTALVFATLKQPPQGLGERVQVEWITAGVAGTQPLKAAA